MKSDFHFHLENGKYSKEWLEQFLDEGSRKNIRCFGIVEHIYNFKEYKNIFMDLSNHLRKGRIQMEWLDSCNHSNIYEYINFMEKMKKIYNNLYLGLEMDYLPEHIKELKKISTQFNWDFIIGSIHMLDNWVFDNYNEQDEWQYRDLKSTYDKYYNMIIDEIDTGIFNIIGHIGNLKVYCHRDPIIRKDEYIKIAKALKKNDVALEINTGLMYRYPVKEICPDFQLLNICNKEGVDITISSDAHMPKDVGNYHDYAVSYAKEAGYTKQVIFINKKKKIVDLE